MTVKIAHGFYPCKDIYVNCSLCLSSPELIEPLFWSCPHPLSFWQDVCHLICWHNEFYLSYENVLFGFFNYPSKKKQISTTSLIWSYYSQNHIHKSKISDIRPSFLHFKNKAKLYIFSIKTSKNKKSSCSFVYPNIIFL